MKHESLDDKSKEILDYAKSQGFNVFYGKELSMDYELVETIWDLSEEWKGFFDIAKNEDIKTIIASIQVFRKDNAFMIEGEEALINEAISQSKAELNELSEVDGKVGSYIFSWIKDSVRYSLSETTDWYKEYKSVMSSIESELVKRQRLGMQGGYHREEQTEEVPELLKKKSEEELANEMVAFMRKESPNPNTRDFYMLKPMFWTERGIARFNYNPKVDLIKNRVELKAQKILDDEQTKEEKEQMPKLVEQCLQWCKGKNLKKVTQGDIGAFLTDNEISLSSNGLRTLWQKVNVTLKST